MPIQYKVLYARSLDDVPPGRCSDPSPPLVLPRLLRDGRLGDDRDDPRDLEQAQKALYEGQAAFRGAEEAPPGEVQAEEPAEEEAQG